MSKQRVGFLLVGISGNNGTTFCASWLANRRGMVWYDEFGDLKQSNWYGSVLMSGTTFLGGKYVPFRDICPKILDPICDEIILSGWDIQAKTLYESAIANRVLPKSLLFDLQTELNGITVMPGVYNPEFIATNQSSRVNHTIYGSTPREYINTLRENIRNFRSKNHLDRVIVIWTANTERMSELADMPLEHFLAFLKGGHKEISPSMLYAIASIEEGCVYINGSPQNTFHPCIVELAIRHGVYLAGNDFKTGQTKMKSILVESMIGTGIKPKSIVSYNHLGNNDGKNLSQENCFRSKEKSKSDVVMDMVESNTILYGEDEKPDHIVVIKYVPYVNDSKRAMDEYLSEICMNGKQSIVIHNVCEDSLLAVPIMLDILLFSEYLSRPENQNGRVNPGYPLLYELGLFFKAPQTNKSGKIVNAFFRQKMMLENTCRKINGIKFDDFLN